MNHIIFLVVFLIVVVDISPHKNTRRESIYIFQIYFLFSSIVSYINLIRFQFKDIINMILNRKKEREKRDYMYLF